MNARDRRPDLKSKAQNVKPLSEDCRTAMNTRPCSSVFTGGFSLYDAAILAALLLLLTIVLWPILSAPADRAPGLPGHDGRTQWYPWRSYGFGSIKDGVLPLWNPYVMCGVPFVGNSQSALFYPPNLLFVVAPVGVAARWSIWLHLALSLVFTYALARALALSPGGSAVAAIAFTFSAAQLLRVPAGHWGVSCAIPWLVLALLCAERIIRGAGLMALVVGAVAVAFQVLSGMPQYVFMTVITIAVSAIARSYRDGLSWGHRLRGWAALAGMFALGASVAAVQLLPSLEAALNGARSLPMRREWIEQFSLGPECLLTLLLPGFFGGQASHPYWGRFLHWEMNAYAGIVVLALAITGIIFGRRRLAVWLGSLAGFMLLLALGRHTPLLRLLSLLTPFSGMFRGSAKFILPFSLAASLLAASGADALLSADTRKGSFRKAIPAAGIMVIILGLVLFRQSILSGLHRLVTAGGECLYASGQVAPSAAAVLRGSCVSLALLGGLLVGVPLLVSRRRLSAGLVVMLVAADAFLFGGMFVSREATFAARGTDWPDAGAEVLRLLGNRKRTVVLGSPAMNDAMLERVFSMEGIEPNPPQRFHLFFRLGQNLPADVAPSLYQLVERGRVATRTAAGRILVRKADAPRITDAQLLWSDGTWDLWDLNGSLPRALIVYSASLAESASEALRMTLEADLADEVILEEAWDLPKAGTPSETTEATITQDAANRVTVAARLEKPGWLVLLDNDFPGWSAEVDGSPARILRANFCFRAVPLASGRHVVTFRYRPPSLFAGLGVSMGGLVFCAVAVILWAKRASREAR